MLAADDFLQSFQMGVETYKACSVERLRWFSKAVDKVVEIARSVKGVKSVKNDLMMK